ncbi:cytochrome P450 3A30-like [Lampris incognitus]|uniref:cytochrome P450 3A30-like n=1 Tax=Lampris incognitus TaxID=2546036 RepID=UPI0024B4A330|nr:cytochrome P450 3A30-like [Lampris incognitus]
MVTWDFRHFLVIRRLFSRLTWWRNRSKMSLPLFSATTWTLLILLFTLLIIYGVWPYGFFKKLGIPGPRPLPFVGTIPFALKKPSHFDIDCQRKYGNVWGLFEGRKPLLMVTDPEMIKAILVKECYSTFTNRREFASEIAGPFVDGITVVKDEKWKRIRNTVSPSFTSGRLRQIFPLVERYADRLIGTLKKRNLEDSISVKEFMASYSLDVVTSASFSVDTDSTNNPEDHFVLQVKKILKMRFWLLFVTLIFPFSVLLFKLLDIGLMPKDSVEYFYNVIKRIKNQHVAEESKRTDFLQLMIQNEIPATQIQNDEQPSKGLTENEILSQAFIFILGGYDTTSTTLSYILYHLAINPDAMHTLQEEIDSNLTKDDSISYDSLMSLQYLDQVICESMRLTPTAPRLERLCKATIQLNGVTIPQGTLVGIPAYLLHVSPQYWSTPGLFKPERFSKDNGEEVNPYAYMPFGLGPRNCVGMRFALLVMKVVLLRLLQNYNVKSCRETVIPLEFNMIFQPKTPIKLKFSPR